MARIKCNDKQLEQVLNYILAKAEGKKPPEISVGKGMFAPHIDGEHVVLESRGGGKSGGACRKWSISISTKDGGAVATLNSGTVNGLAASNQGEEVSFSKDAAKLFLIASVTAEEGQITSWDFDAVTKQPEQTVSVGTPSDFEFTVATLIGGVLKTSFCGNVSATPALMFSTSKKNPKAGEEPFERHYGWQVSDDGAC